MPKNSGPTKRDMFAAHNATGAGKGDADRSPGWRDHYHEINWGPNEWESGAPVGFVEVAPKHFRKVYGRTPTVLIESGLCRCCGRETTRRGVFGPESGATGMVCESCAGVTTE